MDRAVILVSGGINSAVAAAAMREQCQLAWLHVAWGHRSAERELIAFEAMAHHFKADPTLVAELSCMAAIGGNARASRRLSIEDAEVLTGKTPSTFAAGLLPAMISVAAAWAASLKARRIILGIASDHQTGRYPLSQLYPDHRREFAQACNLMLAYATAPGQEIRVETPLMDLSRPEVIKLGRRLGVPFDRTWSCYADNETPCQRCLGCADRAAGFVRAGVPDPLMAVPASAR
jgi:7-cyano-7-deazaguanine synthase